jgi:UDP:flavonoid glycosyltransferase YjiC (YdhE family)
MMETVKFGVPSLIIPFHTEQEGNGRRLEHQGAGRVIGPSNSIECYKLISFRWRNGDFSTWVQPRSQLMPEELYESVRVIMESPEFKDSAVALRDIAHEYAGANGAIDTIQTLIEA